MAVAPTRFADSASHMPVHASRLPATARIENKRAFGRPPDLPSTPAPAHDFNET
jgi:hypothetical protein